jgi:hypothetical protein
LEEVSRGELGKEVAEIEDWALGLFRAIAKY